MVEAIRRSPASTAVVSTERLSSSSTPHVRALVERLAPSEVHVVVTLRDLARVLPSDWQSKVKQGRTWTFPEYAAAATERTTGHQAAHRKFWAHHDAPEIVRRWLEVIPPERVHLVTVPPSGSPPDALWQRFCAVIGVAPDRYDIIQDQKSNFSLTYSDTEFLRQINVRVGKKLERTQKHRWVTRYAANYLLRPSSAADSAKDRPVLMAEEYLWTRQRARDIVAQLRELRVDVVGDLDDLVPPPRQDLSSEPSRPAVVYPDRAAELVASLILKIADLDPGADTRRASANAAEGTDEGVVAKTGSKREKRRAKSERRRNKRRMNQDESRRRTSGQQISEAETAVRSTEPGVLSAATNSSRSPR
jgi:hypothetical protein